MNYYEKREAEAIAKLKELLKKPISEDDQMISVDDFDPWEHFQLYGSYSSVFDDMAILTLTDILNGTYEAEKEYELAQEMFREMLCEQGLCDYGTSPRVCFPTAEFKKLLPEYIAKWKEYYKMMWGRDD